MEYAPQILLLFFFIALVAATFDAIAGGGGLLLLPSLLLLGMPPATAIATNKVGAVAGSFSATLHFVRKGKIALKDSLGLVLCTFIGAVMGGFVLTLIDSAILGKIIPIFLIGFALYFIFSPNIGLTDKTSTIPRWVFALCLCPLLGFYDGFFGPGAGTFMAISFVLLLGHNLVSATAHAKLLNLTSNFASLLYFIFFGDIHWDIGISMLLGQLIGGYIGARLVLIKGQKFIRTVMVVVTLSISVKLLFF